MLSRWFNRGSRLTHPQRDKRLQAVLALDAEQADAAEATLLQLAREDEHADIRTAAAQRLVSADALAQLLDDERLAPTAAARLVALLKSGRDTPAQDHPRVVQARIEQAEDTDVAALLPLMQTPEQCAELALRLRDEARRQVLEHPLLGSEAGLAVLQRTAKGRDKSCHRHARERLDEIKALRLRCGELSRRIAELDDAIVRTLQNAPDDHSALFTHRQRLQKLAAQRRDALTELEPGVERLTAVGCQVAEFDVGEDPLSGVDISLPEPVADPFPPLLAGLEQLDAAMRRGAELATVQEQRDTLTNQWLTHADQHPPAPGQHDVFERVSAQYQAYRAAWERFEELHGYRQGLPEPLPEPAALNEQTSNALRSHRQWLKRWQKPISQLQWPAEHTPPAAVTEMFATAERIEEEYRQLGQCIADGEKQLRQALAAAETALASGALEQARGHLRELRALQKLGIQGPEREIAAIGAKFGEFRDWQQFATNPKRQSLLSALQTLADKPEAPTRQAARLKQLRAEWRQLGKPGSAEEFAQQQTFDELAERAFEPCREYYAEQAKARAENLARREALCEQLQTYLSNVDWNNADMQAAESIMRHARSEWRQYHPCDRRALKPVEDRFEELIDTLHGKVKAEWDANVARKQALVEAATALLDEDLDVQIERAKALQQQWREVGSTPRGPDQRLWREFRNVCDRIFAGRDEAREQHKAALAAEHQALDDAINALKEAAAAAQPNRKTFNELDGQIESHARALKLSADVRRRIEQARDAYRAALDRQAKAGALAELESFRSWDHSISAAEHGGQQDALPEPPHPFFAARCQGDAAAADRLALVLEAEIAADIASPAEDQAARMALQVELMNAGRRDLGAEDYRDLLERWCSTRSREDEAPQLRERFFTALARRV